MFDSMNDLMLTAMTNLIDIFITNGNLMVDIMVSLMID